MNRNELVEVAESYGIRNANMMNSKQIEDELSSLGYEDLESHEEEKPISKMTRKELEEKAEQLGIEDPKSFAKKGELISAIKEL